MQSSHRDIKIVAGYYHTCILKEREYVYEDEGYSDYDIDSDG